MSLYSIKIAYAHQFATETVIVQEDLVYTTETDLLEQEARSAQIDASGSIACVNRVFNSKFASKKA